MLDQISNSAFAEKKNTVVVDLIDPFDNSVKTVEYEIPRTEDGKNISALTLHLGFVQVFSLIMQIEADRIKMVVDKHKADGVVASDIPTFDQGLVQRTFRDHLMIVWSNLKQASVDGLANPDGYAAYWESYWLKERDQGVATYNPLVTMFLFSGLIPTFDASGRFAGFKKTSPWDKALGPGSSVVVEQALKDNDGPDMGHFGFLRHPFISLRDVGFNGSLPLEPDEHNFAVSDVPVMSTQLRMFASKVEEKIVVDHNGRRKLVKEPARLNSDINEPGQIVTLDDIKTIDGRKAYALTNFSSLGAIFYNYVNFARNGRAILDNILRKDVSQWDAKTLIATLRKNAKYALKLFPSVGLEIEYSDPSDQHAVTADVFLDIFAIYIVTIMSIMKVQPHAFLDGGDKDLMAVEHFLQAELTRNTLKDEHDMHVVYGVIKALFQAGIFKREFFQAIVKEVKNVSKVT